MIPGDVVTIRKSSWLMKSPKVTRRSRYVPSLDVMSKSSFLKDFLTLVIGVTRASDGSCWFAFVLAPDGKFGYVGDWDVSVHR